MSHSLQEGEEGLSAPLYPVPEALPGTGIETLDLVQEIREVEVIPPACNPRPGSIQGIASLLHVFPGGHQENGLSEESRFADRLEACRAGVPTTPGQKIQEYPVVQAVEGEALSRRGDGRNIGSIPETVKLHLGVISMPAVQLLRISRVQNVGQDVVAPGGFGIQDGVPQKGRDHPDPPMGKVREGGEGESQMKSSAQGSQEGVPFDGLNVPPALPARRELWVEEEELMPHGHHWDARSVDENVETSQEVIEVQDQMRAGLQHPAMNLRPHCPVPRDLRNGSKHR